MNVAFATTARRDVMMSAARPRETSAGYVVLFLTIPGLGRMAAECAMLIGRLLQETIDGDLAGKDLLVDGPPSSRSIMAAMQKDTAARLKEIKTQVRGSIPEAGDGSTASRRFIEDVAERLYGDEPLLSFVRHEDHFYFEFHVSDFRAGQAAVAAEMKRLGFLELAEIGHYDPEDKVCRTHHPKNPNTSVTPHCVEVLKAAGLLPL